MADEPRRSGRATKGQHNKDREVVEEPTPSKGKGRGRATKATKTVEPDEEEDAEELIRCICGEYEEEEDFPRSMICCEKCTAWQHNMCMGLPEDYEVEEYFCEQCRPEDHKDLLAAMARGEQPWVVALEQMKAAVTGKGSKKKGKKGGRKSVTTTPATPAPEVEKSARTTGQKRKAEETPSAELKVKKVRGTPAAENGTKAASPGRKSSTPVAQMTKSEPESEPEPEVAAEVTSDGVAADVKELTNATRKGAANSLIKLFTDQVKEAVKAGTYTIPAGSSTQAAGAQLGLQVEHAIFQAVQQGAGEPGDLYKSQLRAISFNVKKNPALGKRIINKNVTPHELASMDPKNMASEEQQKKDAAMKEEMDKQHTIVHEQGPRIRRTHKGEEYVDEAHQVAAESTTSKAPTRKQSTIDQSADVKSPTGEEKPTKPRKPLSVNTQPKSRPSVDPRRKSSTNFDIDKVWSGVQGSPDGETPRLSEAPQRDSPPPVGSGAGTDPEIDNLLKDEENESEPYSPKDFDEEGIVWRGSVNGGNLGRFRTTAKFAAGATPDADTLRLTWEKVIPAEIVIHGRIQPQKADDYLCGLEYSSTSDLIVVTMAEPRERDDVEGFEKLFKYFKAKQRYGVGVQHENPAIKDIYLLPMDAGQALPTFMKALETDFADPVAERMILVPIVIKNSELPHNLNAAGQSAMMSPSVGPHIAQTPITPQEGQRDFGPPPPYQYSQPANGTPQPAVHQTPPAGQNQWNPPPSYAPSQSPIPQGPAMPPNPTPAVSAAYRILGPQLANSSAVQQLLRTAPNVGDTEMQIVYECILEDASAANDLGTLTKMLQLRSQRSKGQQGHSSSQPQGQPPESGQAATAPGGAATQTQTSA